MDKNVFYVEIEHILINLKIVVQIVSHFVLIVQMVLIAFNVKQILSITLLHLNVKFANKIH